jgi:hypothetical protein
MADQEKDKQMQIDETLDSLLASYSSVEPRPGLETRILANLRDAESGEASRGWWGFKWLWAGAALAVAMVVAFLLIGGRHQVSPPANTVVQTLRPAVQQPVIQEPGVQGSVPAKVGASPAVHRHKTLAPVPPQSAILAVSQRPANFPTPAPLSEQERLMFTYLENTPQEIVVAQLPRNDDQKEAEAFWADREPSSGTRRSTNTR